MIDSHHRTPRESPQMLSNKCWRYFSACLFISLEFRTDGKKKNWYSLSNWCYWFSNCLGNPINDLTKTSRYFEKKIVFCRNTRKFDIFVRYLGPQKIQQQQQKNTQRKIETLIPNEFGGQLNWSDRHNAQINDSHSKYPFPID